MARKSVSSSSSASASGIRKQFAKFVQKREEAAFEQSKEWAKRLSDSSNAVQQLQKNIQAVMNAPKNGFEESDTEESCAEFLHSVKDTINTCSIALQRVTQALQLIEKENGSDLMNTLSDLSTQTQKAQLYLEYTIPLAHRQLIQGLSLSLQSEDKHETY
ncbi:meiotic recombination protein Rec25 [Schizosaccharomyces japonicus yFS275]|uniref:Meiotic recombination protein Rec25 n=1 Tax=Schizosaccharomyces japonicus (strain yFS275 / FY16936) TaxID=402676 RepID=B6K6H1_SCHJY|nr:meiotic recombination protein Rec25 [Schizosaccharomyces japonicus yFS275]EEB09125.1 meiotic recombination protein Rec25 [Schizosaccharomyces japonicus yFS275]